MVLEDGLYRLVTEQFVAGFIVENGNITKCAPILRRRLDHWMTVAERITVSDKQEAKITVLRNYGGFRADSVAELRQLVTQLLGEGAWEPFLDGVRQDFGIVTMAGAVENLQQGGLTNEQPPTSPPQQQYAQQQPQYQQVPQPQYQQQAQVQQANQQQGDVPPPTIPYPGNCAHGQRVYFANHPKTGAAWPRWECALKWTRQNKDQRCETINA